MVTGPIDAFEQNYFGNPENVLMAIERRALGKPPWFLTDDSIMAISLNLSLPPKLKISTQIPCQSWRLT